MQPLKPQLPRKYSPNSQAGFSLILLALVVLVGFGTMVVFALNGTQARIERDKVTADALAVAKEALIGYAVSDANRPGELPCPDINDDGIISPTGPNADYSGSNCISLIGRLPWKTLGLPDLRDSSGERLWYALSDPFHANDTAVLNSDTAGTLSVSGTTTANQVIAIVFATGNVLSGQSRSATQAAVCASSGSTVVESWCATNYLEGSNANLSTTATPNLSYQTAAASPTFNDRLISITSDKLFPTIEMRIAREARNCLDNYALSSVNKYPWAVPATDITSYTGTHNTFFGRLSTPPSNVTSGGSPDPDMLNTWPPSCTLFTSSPYWPDWQNLVFYQVAVGYQPGGSASCTGANCITINSSGAYRAAVLVARRAIGVQVRNPIDSTTYLENLNQHQATLTTTFETYNSSDLNYSTVNDLVLCLDGKNNCK